MKTVLAWIKQLFKKEKVQNMIDVWWGNEIAKARIRLDTGSSYWLEIPGVISFFEHKLSTRIVKNNPDQIFPIGCEKWAAVRTYTEGKLVWAVGLKKIHLTFPDQSLIDIPKDVAYLLEAYLNRDFRVPVII